MKKSLLAFVTTSVAMAAATTASTAATAQPAAPLQALPSLEVRVLHGHLVPGAVDSQPLPADTTATYRDLGDGTVEVLNRCRTADGKSDSVTGIARPPAGVSRIEAGKLQPAHRLAPRWSSSRPVSRIEAGKLQPARLEVSFLPAWLRWTGIGWGAYGS